MVIYFQLSNITEQWLLLAGQTLVAYHMSQNLVRKNIWCFKCQLHLERIKFDKLNACCRTLHLAIYCILAYIVKPR